jgi:hypothetical protein
MPGLVPGIHVLAAKKDVDGRDKPGHDEQDAAIRVKQERAKKAAPFARGRLIHLCERGA